MGGSHIEITGAFKIARGVKIVSNSNVMIDI